MRRSTSKPEQSGRPKIKQDQRIGRQTPADLQRRLQAEGIVHVCIRQHRPHRHPQSLMDQRMIIDDQYVHGRLLLVPAEESAVSSYETRVFVPWTELAFLAIAYAYEKKKNNHTALGALHSPLPLVYQKKMGRGPLAP